MPAPFDTETLGNGNALFRTDGAGNIFLPGTANIGTAIALHANANAPIQAPGQLTLWTPDGNSLSMVSPSGAVTPVSFGPQFATVTKSAPQTVTGTTAKTALLTAAALPSGTLAAGQVYRVTAWGALTTTASTQTVTFEVDFGSTSVFGWGAQEPNSGGTETGSAWFWDVTLLVQAGPKVTGAGTDSLAFFPYGTNQSTPTTVTNTGTQGFSIQLTNSDVAVSVTCNGAIIRRVN